VFTPRLILGQRLGFQAFPLFLLSLKSTNLIYHQHHLVVPNYGQYLAKSTAIYVRSHKPITLQGLSAMADIGVIGSGLGIASLALQLSDCIAQLKSFWKAVKDAPEEIKYLLEEIETLSFALSDFEANDEPKLNIGQEATFKCFQFCKKAIGVLDSVIKEVEVEIKKRRRVGSVKAVLRRDVIEKWRERLTRAQSMLMLSNSLYLV
jgi:hypothetical protein